MSQVWKLNALAFLAVAVTLILGGSLTASADSHSADDPVYFALSGGLSFADVSKTADANGQALANALGQTVSVSMTGRPGRVD